MDGTVDSTVAEAGEDAEIDSPEEPPPRIPCVPAVGGDAGDAGNAADGSPDAGDAGAPDGGTVADSGSDGAPTGSCPGTLTCCGGWCTDLTKDPQNCGSCGNACMSAQFCTGTSCDDAVLKNLCANSHATVVLDPFGADDEAGAGLGAGLATGCMPGVTVRTIPQDAGVLDRKSGRPITGPGDTLVAGGGFFGQLGVDYMEKNKVAPLALGTDGNNSWIRNNKTGANVVLIPNTMLGSHLDYFALEVSVEPKSGTFCFFGFGILVPGTEAAAYYFEHSVATNIAMFPDAWYVYEWADTDSDGVPSAGDTFTPIGQGN
jgi:hypothetical protein